MLHHAHVGDTGPTSSAWRGRNGRSRRRSTTTTVDVVGGTSWLFSRPSSSGSLRHAHRRRGRPDVARRRARGVARGAQPRARRRSAAARATAAGESSTGRRRLGARPPARRRRHHRCPTAACCSTSRGGCIPTCARSSRAPSTRAGSGRNRSAHAGGARGRRRDDRAPRMRSSSTRAIASAPTPRRARCATSSIS